MLQEEEQAVLSTSGELVDICTITEEDIHDHFPASTAGLMEGSSTFVVHSIGLCVAL